MRDLDIICVCRAFSDIYIYGAGTNAKKIYNYLLCHELTVAGFIVSDIHNNPDRLFGLPVIEASDFIQKDGDAVLCSVIYLSPYYNDVFAKIMQYRLQRVVFFSRKTFAPIAAFNAPQNGYDEFKKLRDIFKGTNYAVTSDEYNEVNHCRMTMIDGRCKFSWRIQKNLFENIKSVDEMEKGRSVASEFTEQYGEYYALEGNFDKNIRPAINARVYMAVNVGDSFQNFQNMADYVTPIQSGAALTDVSLCELKDNVGDNISEKNQNYSECTALYWLWRNAPRSDYIGLCQYRRHLRIPNDDIGLLEQNNIDILTTEQTFLPIPVKTLFKKFLPEYDVDLFFAAIREKKPEYVCATEKFFCSRFYPPCNVFVMRYDIFKEYAEDAFALAFAVEAYYQHRNIIRSDRYMGYLIECFLGIFLMYHKDDYKIAYTPMKFYRNKL